MKKAILAISVCAAAFAACNPEKKMVPARVIDTGDITADGCGYLLRLEDSALLRSNNLPSAYHHHNMPVLVEYSYTGKKDTCNYGPKVYEIVNIVRIKNNY